VWGISGILRTYRNKVPRPARDALASHACELLLIVPGCSHRAIAPPGTSPGGASTNTGWSRWWALTALYKASSSTSTQCFTGVAVPLCRCWMQPTLALMMVCACRGARLPSLRSRNW